MPVWASICADRLAALTFRSMSPSRATTDSRFPVSSTFSAAPGKPTPFSAVMASACDVIVALLILVTLPSEEDSAVVPPPFRMSAPTIRLASELIVTLPAALPVKRMLIGTSADTRRQSVRSTRPYLIGSVLPGVRCVWLRADALLPMESVNTASSGPKSFVQGETHRTAALLIPDPN